MSPEMLEAIFVQRQQLVEHLIELVEDSCNSQNKHFRLLVGMRGIGKTHTIALLYHRLQEKTELQDKLLIAWLKEEEWGVSSWLDLLLRIFQALEKKYTVEYHLKIAQQIEDLYQLPVEQATSAAEAILKEFIADKTLLLLTENLDDIFNGLGDLGQKQFRAFLQNHNLVSIVATSQSLFNGVSKKDAAFYGFFTPEYLKKLTIPEATNLLEKIAETRKDTELASFIQSTTGKDRIKAIHHLAGGNHRVYIIFSQFLTRESLDELVQPVMQTLDELTPYYQARMQWLSPQQRKIVELLCDTRNPITVKEIARKCFITHQTASSQLKDLRKKGYVVTVADIATGRESYYELQEPLMRICLEVKKQRGEPIKLFIDFLRIWYTEEELKQRLEMLPKDCLERDYIEQALIIKNSIYISANYSNDLNSDRNLDMGVFNIINGNYQEAITLFDQALNNNKDNDYAWTNRGLCFTNLKRYEAAIESYEKSLSINKKSYLSWHHYGVSLKNIKKYNEAIKCFDLSIQIEPRYHISWNSKGLLLMELKKYKEALDCYNKALEIKPEYHLALNNKGLALYHMGEYDKAIKSYRIALNIDPKFYLSWNNLTLALIDLNKYDEAIESCEMGLRIEPNFHSLWNNKGLALFHMKKYSEAISSYNIALDIKHDFYSCWNNKGLALHELGKYNEAIESYNISLAIEPDFHLSWNNKGLALLALYKYKKAIDCFNKALELNPEYYIAWNHIGLAKFRLFKHEEAIDYFNKALELNPGYYKCLCNLGIVLCLENQFKRAQLSFTKALEIKQDFSRARFGLSYVFYKLEEYTNSVESYNKVLRNKSNLEYINYDRHYAYFDRIEPILKLNRWQEGFKDLNEALNRFQDSSDSYKGDTKEYIKIIWESTTDIAVWKTRLQTLVETYAKYDLAGELTKGITNHIPTLMSDMVSDKAARSWLEIWQDIAGDKPELSIALRFLKTAVEYKETKGDRKVLLQLAREERELIEELLAKAE